MPICTLWAGSEAGRGQDPEKSTQRASQITPTLTPILPNWLQNYANMHPVGGFRGGAGPGPWKINSASQITPKLTQILDLLMKLNEKQPFLQWKGKVPKCQFSKNHFSAKWKNTLLFIILNSSTSHGTPLVAIWEKSVLGLMEKMTAEVDPFSTLVWVWRFEK